MLHLQVFFKIPGSPYRSEAIAVVFLSLELKGKIK